MEVDRRIHRQVVHVLDPADHLHVLRTGNDCMASLRECLQTRATQPVGRGARHRQRQAGEEGGGAGHIPPQLTPLLGHAENDILHRLRIDTAAFHRSPHHSRGQFIAAHMAKQATQRMGLADRRSAAGHHNRRRLRGTMPGGIGTGGGGPAAAHRFTPDGGRR